MQTLPSNQRTKPALKKVQRVASVSPTLPQETPKKENTVEIAQLWQHKPRQLHYSNNLSNKIKEEKKKNELVVLAMRTLSPAGL